MTIDISEVATATFELCVLLRRARIRKRNEAGKEQRHEAWSEGLKNAHTAVNICKKREKNSFKVV